MARPYAEEMAKLAETFAWARAADLQPLCQAVRSAGLSPLRAIGSGGSLTGAHALAGLHQRYTGHVATVATPLEAADEPLGATVATWLLSAGGGDPHDTCPILPFPASNPRLGDTLAEEYLTELEDTWSVDTRNIVYTDEGDPLDLYRTILRLDALRQPVFAETGGSMLILSPLGSKVMALGALMAALERDLPVAHVESLGYDLEASVPEQIDQPDLIHVWLEGEVYPQPRPALPM